MIEYISILFVVLAAAFNAVMDSVEYEAVFNKSIFSKYDPKWWLKTVSWQYVKFVPFTKYRIDAWHLSKTFFICFFILALVFYNVICTKVVDILLFGLLWNIVYNFFYNHVFKKP